MIQYIFGGGVLVVLCGVVAKVAGKVNNKDCEDRRNCIEGKLTEQLVMLTEIKTNQEHMIKKFDKITKISVIEED